MTEPNKLTRPYVVLVVDLAGMAIRPFPERAMRATSFEESRGIIIFGGEGAVKAGMRIFKDSDKIRRVVIEEFGDVSTPEKLAAAETALQTLLDRNVDWFRPIPQGIMPVVAVDQENAAHLLSIYSNKQRVSYAPPQVGALHVVIPFGCNLREGINRTTTLLGPDNSFIGSDTHRIALLRLDQA